MRTRIQTAAAALLIALLVALAACTESTAPSRGLEVRPNAPVVNLSDVQQSGVAGTFVNRTTSSVTLYSASCIGTLATLELALPGGWVEVPLPQLLCIASMLAPVPTIVAPGDSVAVYASGHGVVVGRYRMRVRSTGADATSGSFEVR